MTRTAFASSARPAALLHRLASELAGAGINLRSVSASVIKSRCVMFFAFDAASDRDQAALLLGK